MESGETVNPEIKDRIAKIKAGQMPEGYKKTKVGIVPQEWKSKPISHYLTLVERSIVMDDNAEYELVTVRRGFGGVDSRGFLLGKKILVKSQFTINEKDFVISKRQIAHGACGIVPKELDGAIVSNEYNVFTGRDNVDIVFFNYFVQLVELKRLFYLMSNGVHIEKLLFKTNDWLKQKICVPSLAEQQKIAKILTTWDKGIELKQKLIAKKKVQKKWLMEDLLNPFGNEQLVIGSMALNKSKWEEVTLGEVVDTFSGGTPSRDVAWFYGGKINWIKSGELNNKIVVDTEEFITEDGLNNSSAKMVYPGYILLALYGATAGVMAITGIEAAINQAILAINAKGKTHNAFLYHCLDYQMNDIVKKYTQGGQPNLNADIVKNLKIYLPLPHEQATIAEILSTMDKEIELMEKQLSELVQQKKGLMQLLMTGIVRV